MSTDPNRTRAWDILSADPRWARVTQDLQSGKIPTTIGEEIAKRIVEQAGGTWAKGTRIEENGTIGTDLWADRHKKALIIAGLAAATGGAGLAAMGGVGAASAAGAGAASTGLTSAGIAGVPFAAGIGSMGAAGAAGAAGAGGGLASLTGGSGGLAGVAKYAPYVEKGLSAWGQYSAGKQDQQNSAFQQDLLSRQDRRTDETDIMRKLNQTAYLGSGGYQGAPGKYLQGPQAVSPAQQQASQALEQQLLRRLMENRNGR